MLFICFRHVDGIVKLTFVIFCIDFEWHSVMDVMNQANFGPKIIPTNKTGDVCIILCRQCVYWIVDETRSSKISFFVHERIKTILLIIR